MTLTATQREARRAYIGSSDAPAIMGLAPRRTPHDVYLAKVAELDDDVSPQMEAGNLLEPVLIEWASQKLRRQIRRRGEMITKGELCVNLDADLSDSEIIEAKTTGITDGWGEEETDAIPDPVLIQTHHAFHVTGAIVAWVPVIIGRFGLSFKLYRVERDDRLCRMVADAGTTFMREHVAKRIPPLAAPSLDVVKRIRRVPGTWADLNERTVRDWMATKDALKTLTARHETNTARLLAEMGTAEGGRSPAGIITYFESSRRAYEVPATTYRSLKGPKAQ